MEYYGNKLCISVRELDADGILTGDYCRQLAKRNRLKMASRGGGKGNYALVVVESLPTPYLDQVKEKHPGGNAVLLCGWILSNYELDQAAVAYFMDWAARQHSDKATDGLARKYAVNASVPNTCIRLYNRSRDYRKLMGREIQLDMMAATIETLREEFGHDLPASTLRFRKKVNEYKQYGYECLISGKFGNQSARKVDYKTERLILSLAAQENKPYTIRRCRDCDVAKGKLKLAFVPDNELCAACEILHKCAGDREKTQRAIERTHYLHGMKPLLKKSETLNANGTDIRVSFSAYGNKHLFSDTFGRSSILRKDDLASLDEVLKGAEFMDDAALTHPRTDGIEHFYYFKAQIRGQWVRLNVAKEVKHRPNGFVRVSYYLYLINDI